MREDEHGRTKDHDSQQKVSNPHSVALERGRPSGEVKVSRINSADTRDANLAIPPREIP